MWLLFACGSALCAGVTAILAKRGMRGISATVATALRTIVVLIFAWIMVFVTGAQDGLRALDGRTLILLTLSGLATGASWLCYFRALQLGDVNQVTPVDKSSTVLTMLLGFGLLGEPFGLAQLVAMLAIGGGTLLMIARPDTVSAGRQGYRWLPYACGSALFASLTAILGKLGMAQIPSDLGTAIRTGVVLVMAWGMVFVEGRQHELSKLCADDLGPLLLSGVTTGLSWLCYFRALQTGPASVVVPIDKLSILVTVAFARLVLGERLTPRARLGLCSLTAGTLLLLV